MTRQLELFGPGAPPPAAYPDVAGATEETTSRSAAKEIEASGRASILRDRCEAWFGAGHRGTADECAAALGETILAVRPRVTELVKQGVLRRTDERRRSDGGRMAAVIESA